MDIHKINSKEELLGILPKLSGKFILERYIKGDEYSVDVATVASQHKTLLLAKKSCFENSYVEKSHLIDNSIQEGTLKLLEYEVDRFLNSIGYESGMAHIELKLFDEEVEFIECQLRMGGDHLFDVYELITGCDLSEVAYQIEEGEISSISDIKSALRPNLTALIDYKHFYSESMQFVKWNSASLLQKTPHIFTSELPSSPETFNKKLKSSFDRNYCVVYVASDLSRILLSKGIIDKNVYPLFKLSASKHE